MKTKLPKGAKINLLKKEVEFIIRSIKMSQDSIKQNSELLKEKTSKQARGFIKRDIENDKNAIHQWLEQKEIFEAMLGDYEK